MTEKILKLIVKIPFLGEKIYKFCKVYNLIYKHEEYNIYKNGELQLLENVESFSESAKQVIFDVGANVGEYSVIAKKINKEAQIHCFEIHTDTVKTLQGNLKNFSNIVINNFGLSNKSSTVDFLDYGSNSGANSFITAPAFQHLGETKISKSKVITGDEYCAKNKVNKIDVLKIDVEGHEYSVLEGFSTMLSMQNISVIQFEYGYNNGDEHTLMKDFFLFFEKYGYKVGVLRKGGVNFSEFHHRFNDFDSGPNYVALLDKLSLSERLKKFS